MLSLRALARAAPRSVSRLATASRPQLSAVARTAAWRSAVAPRLAAFTTSTRRSDTQTLIAKLDNEYNIEENVPEPEAYSDTLKDFIENSPFEIVDKDGSEDVVLTRKFEKETITVRFSTASINEFPEEEQPNPFDEDPALQDEFNEQSGGANTKGSVNKARTSDGNSKVEPEEEEGEYDESQDEGTTFPAQLNITITKDGHKGALVVDAIAESSAIEINNMFYFPDGKMADPKDPQTEFSRRGIYPGPSFNQLDEDLQLLLEKYLEDRGIDAALAVFIPEYIDFKEQKEYLKWLKNVKNFVAA